MGGCLVVVAVFTGTMHSQAAVITAGELVVDLRALTLSATSQTWTNQDTTGATVGNFTTKGGGNLNVASIGGISKALLVDTIVNNSVLSSATVTAALLGNSTRSVEVWLYATAVTATSAAVGWGTSGTGQQSSCDYNTGGNGLFAGYSMDTGWNGTPISGSWVHVVYTYDGTTVKGYTNGVLNKSITLGPLSTAAAKLSVGSARAATADPFKGYIADVRVHTGVLSATDVANNYSQGIYSSLPVITGLTNQTVQVGGTLALNPTVTGFPAPVFQWRTNGVAIPNQTNATLTVTNIQSGQNGYTYSLVATNLAGKVTNSMTLTVVAIPGITGLNNQAVAPGADVTMTATVSGIPAPTLQWRFNGANLANGATGNGSTIAGVTTSTLYLTNAQAADSGTYSLVASNTAGLTTNSLTLTVSSGNVSPAITGPANQTVVQSNNATFSASASGLPLPTLQWRVNGADIAGATAASLTLTNVLYAQNGFVYSVVASNVAGLVTNSATLTVLVPPSISQQPTNVSVFVGAPANFSVTASGVPTVKYQWSKNGSVIANATNASYVVPSPSGSDNGAVFAVTVSNSVNVVTSSNATLTVFSPMTGAFLPTNGAVNLSYDQQLRIVFSGGTPKLAYTGKKLYVRKASDNSVFATIDTSLFQTFATDSATVSNAFIRTSQGQNFYYMPIAVYGNEAWITLNTSNRFAYGQTYYVNYDAGLFVDANGASFPALAGTNSWRFTIRASGPATPTASTGLTNITVGLDGAGDFATLQGVSDWVPQNNTLKRTITILPGTYRDFAVFTQSRNFVTVIGAGATRDDVEINYPNAAFTSGSSCGLLRAEGTTDMYFRNFTLDNEVYLTNKLNNYGPWAGRLNTLVTKNAKRLIFDNLMIKGGQDTLYADGGITYYNRCEIWGSTDFIYGPALAVFDQCTIVEIKESGGPITAPSTPSAAPYGLVFTGCNFPRALKANGYPYDVGTASTTFMRPWGQDGMTAIINCALGSQITTKGWSEWGGREATCRAREAGSTLIAGGAVTPAQRQAVGAFWVNTIDPDYTSTSMSPTNALLALPSGPSNRTAVTVNTNDYTLSAIYGNAYYNLGGWLPTLIPTITTHPTNRQVTAGASVAFTVAATGVPTPTYQWRQNGTNLVGQTAATLTFNNVQVAAAGTYSVLVSNSAGTLISSNALLTVIPAINLTPTNLLMNLSGSALQFSWPADRIGWRLETQTNAPGAGLTTNWQTVASSQFTNQISVPVGTAAGSVFFRLVYP